VIATRSEGVAFAQPLPTCTVTLPTPFALITTVRLHARRRRHADRGQVLHP